MDEIRTNGENGEDDKQMILAAEPDDTAAWCKQLHCIVNRIYGESGEAPQYSSDDYWYAENDNEFLYQEEERRGLTYGELDFLLYVPYAEKLVMVEYTSGRKAQVDAVLFGTGEKLGEWESFTALFAKPQWRLHPLVCGQKVQLSGYKMAVVARILRGTKSAGRADEAKTQHCYYALVLIETDQTFEYIALQHIYYKHLEFHRLWDEEGAVGGRLCTDEDGRLCGKKLLHFKPKSVSAVAKAAAQYASMLSGNTPSTKRPRSRASRRSNASAESSDDAGSDDLESNS